MKFNIVYDRRIVSEVENTIIPNGINSNSNNFANEHGENPMSKVVYQEFNTRERDNEFTLEFLKKECDWKVNEIFLDEVSDKVLDNQINL